MMFGPKKLLTLTAPLLVIMGSCGGPKIAIDGLIETSPLLVESQGETFVLVASSGGTIAAIKQEATVQGRAIPNDHYGAGFAFRFGSWDDEIVKGATRGPLARDYLCIGGAADILARILEYQRGGVSKFVLIPLARGNADLFDQTQRLVEEVLPVVHAEGFGWAST